MQRLEQVLKLPDTGTGAIWSRYNRDILSTKLGGSYRYSGGQIVLGYAGESVPFGAPVDFVPGKKCRVRSKEADLLGLP